MSPAGEKAGIGTSLCAVKHELKLVLARTNGAKQAIVQRAIGSARPTTAHLGIQICLLKNQAATDVVKLHSSCVARINGEIEYLTKDIVLVFGQNIRKRGVTGQRAEVGSLSRHNAAGHEKREANFTQGLGHNSHHIKRNYWLGYTALPRTFAMG